MLYLEVEGMQKNVEGEPQQLFKKLIKEPKLKIISNIIFSIMYKNKELK